MFLLTSQVQDVSVKNEQSIQTPWRGAPEARGPMQLHRLHGLKPALIQAMTKDSTLSSENEIIKIWNSLPIILSQ